MLGHKVYNFDFSDTVFFADTDLNLCTAMKPNIFSSHILCHFHRSSSETAFLWRQ